MSFIVGMLSSSIAGGTVNAWLSGVNRQVKYEANKTLPNVLPTAPSLVDMLYRGIIADTDYYQMMLMQGYNKAQAERMYKQGRTTLAIVDLINLKRRNIIQEDEYKRLASEAGYTDNHLRIAEQATIVYPHVEDIIRFAVREVYSKDIVEKFKLNEDFPEAFRIEAEKAGLAPETAQKYWQAHWVLPSVEMGYEMLHRGIISDSELDLLLRTQDVMPFWREKLKKISFAPFTRVDVRRMFKLGVLDFKQVIKAYKDIGYDDFNATKLAEFTAKDVLTDEKELTKADILKLYGFKELKIEVAKAMLIDIGYSEMETKLLLASHDATQKNKDTTEEIKLLTSQFVDNMIQEKDFRESLLHLNLQDKAVERIIVGATQKRKAERKLIDKDDTLLLLKKGIISESEAEKRLEDLNYSSKDASLLIRTVKP